MDIGAAEIRKWHTDPEPDGNGWSDIGYHMVIRRNGVIEQGRPLNRAPAAQVGFNRGTIAICLVGGVDRNNVPRNNFTSKQMSALKRRVEALRKRYDIISIVGHRNFPGVNKKCPSFNVTEWVYHNLNRV